MASEESARKGAGDLPVAKDDLAALDRGLVASGALDEATPADELSATEAVRAYLDAGLDPARLTVSSDSGGCLPRFDADGAMTHMDVGGAAGLLGTLAELVGAGLALERVLPLFTSNPAEQLGLWGSNEPKGRLCEGADADLLVLDEAGRATDVMALGRWLVAGGEPLVRGTFEAAPDHARP